MDKCSGFKGIFIADYGCGVSVEVDRLCGVSCSLPAGGCDGVSQDPPHDGADTGDVNEGDVVEVPYDGRFSLSPLLRHTVAFINVLNASS